MTHHRRGRSRLRDGIDGAQPGDPAGAARVILDVVASDEPKRTAETQKWAADSASADFPADER